MTLNRLKGLCATALVAAGLAFAETSAHAQFFNTGNPTAVADLYTTISNAYLQLGVGGGNNVAGSIGLITTPSSPTDPDTGGFGFGNIILWPAPLVPKDNPPIYTQFYGSWVFVRVDGGEGGVKGGGNGGDYIFGDQRTGIWLTYPTVVGNHLVARWQTIPVLTGDGGGGGIATFDPRIEVDLTATFVHDTVRFQFSVVNNSTGQPHTVGIAFVQDINVQPTVKFTQETDGPLRLQGQPYLHHEALLSGNQIPSRWETFVQVKPATLTAPALIHSERGTLKPLNSSETEPTTPTRFAYGRTISLEGFDLTLGHKARNFDLVWNFQPNSNVYLDQPATSNNTDGSVVDYWDPVQIAAGQTETYITYVGQADSENDFGQPVSLSVSGPIALDLTTDHTVTPAVVKATPDPFTITAYVQNLTDLSQSGGLAIGPVNVFLDLPKGLMLDTTVTGNTATQAITSVAPGAEGQVSWTVKPDPSAGVSGLLTYVVTASPSIGNGKSVQKTIEVPAPPSFTLREGVLNGVALYQMVSIPLTTGTALPTAILGLQTAQPQPTTTQPPSVVIVQWDPTTAHYKSVNSFVPGSAYWLHTTLTADKVVQLDAGAYPPLATQVQPGAATYKVSYPVGWNQIGDPYVYSFKFSEIQVFDTDSLSIVNIVDASDPLHNWILPDLYHYNTSDPDPNNWHYDLLDNLGFVMQPFDGYWMYVEKGNLQFIYPGVDTPGGQVTRAALIGAGVGAASVVHNTTSDWRIQIAAKSKHGSDIASIGMSPTATDGPDRFKISKPPTLNAILSMDIVHTDWSAKSGRFARDLRSSTAGQKSWDLVITSPVPNEDVTVNWGAQNGSIPRTVRLSLVDLDNNTRQAMTNSGSLVVNTGASSVRHLQVVGETVTRSSAAMITSFDVVAAPTRAAGSRQTATINYALSQTADTQVVIRDGSGRTVRTLTPTRAAASANSTTGSVVWDLRDRAGANLPTGHYDVELTAQDQSGHRSRMVKPFLIVR